MTIPDSLVLGLVLYREHFNRRGRVSKLMSDNSFGIYFIHPPIVVTVSQGLGWLPLPPQSLAWRTKMPFQVK